ncbi:hypothetical protein CsatA_010318 [Cannabis sativa]
MSCDHFTATELVAFDSDNDSEIIDECIIIKCDCECKNKKTIVTLSGKIVAQMEWWSIVEQLSSTKYNYLIIVVLAIFLR